MVGVCCAARRERRERSEISPSSVNPFLTPRATPTQHPYPHRSVATILTGLLSFMVTEDATTGSITTTDAQKRAYAEQSHAWNRKHYKFREIFPDKCVVEGAGNVGAVGASGETSAAPTPRNRGRRWR